MTRAYHDKSSAYNIIISIPNYHICLIILLWQWFNNLNVCIKIYSTFIIQSFQSYIIRDKSPCFIVHKEFKQLIIINTRILLIPTLYDMVVT